MKRQLFILSIFVPICISLYDYIPGGLYKEFALHLNYADKIELMKIVFDPHKSRSKALKDAQDWAHKHTPLIEVGLFYFRVYKIILSSDCFHKI
jgi:hypothetical protein